MLVDSLVEEGWLKTPRIIKAFREIKRTDFIPHHFENQNSEGFMPDIEELAELNKALPIGYGQTISQPLTVAFMLEQLQPEPGNKILDIGSGSGWTTALLAHCVSQKGKSQISDRSRESSDPNPKSQINGRVIAIEIVPELKKFGEKNTAKYNFIEKRIVEFICVDATHGYKKEAFYDRILASAAVQGEIPQAWKEQLKVNGRIVAPIRNSIWTLIKKSKKDFEETEHPGFVFVPFVRNKLR